MLEEIKGLPYVGVEVGSNTLSWTYDLTSTGPFLVTAHNTRQIHPPWSDEVEYSQGLTTLQLKSQVKHYCCMDRHMSLDQSDTPPKLFGSDEVPLRGFDSHTDNCSRYFLNSTSERNSSLVAIENTLHPRIVRQRCFRLKMKDGFMLTRDEGTNQKAFQASGCALCAGLFKQQVRVPNVYDAKMK